MNKKDIALTVFGTLASLSLAYLFYREQQNNAAAAATATTDPAYTIADGSTVTYYGSDGYYPQMSSISVPSIAASVTTSADTAATGNSGTSVSSSDATDMITQIVAAFNTATNPNILPAYTISDLTSNIPTTATDALTQANAAHPGTTSVHETTATAANSLFPDRSQLIAGPVVRIGT